MTLLWQKVVVEVPQAAILRWGHGMFFDADYGSHEAQGFHGTVTVHGGRNPHTTL